MNNSSLKNWIRSEFHDISFQEKRLEKRFYKVATGLAEKSEKNICSSFESWKEVKACYRFFSNDKIDYHKILKPHQNRTLERIKKNKRVLLLQDTVYFSYGNRPSTKSLDLCSKNRISAKEIKGLMCHGLLAISDSGLPLGILHQEYINRQKFRGGPSVKNRDYQRRPITEKESIRWINFIEKTNSMDTGDTETIHIADRESDIYELYRDCFSLKENFLIRACNNRAINKVNRRSPVQDKLFDFLESKKAQAIIKVKVNSVKQGQKFREAKLSVIFKEVTMPPPPNKTINNDGGKGLPMLPMTAIMAIERNPPKKEESIKWLLLTNIPVNNVKEAREKIKWYSMRWNIELFHKIIKSGFSVEKAQLRDGENLKKYITLKSVLAWRIFWLTRFFNENKKDNCEKVLTNYEWKILFRKFNKGKNIPSRAPPIEDVFIWIGKLGGFLGRKSDGSPGFISIWRGWMRFMDLIEDYEAFCG